MQVGSCQLLAKDVHLVLVNCLGSLARNSVIRLTDGSPHVPQVRSNLKTHSPLARITAYGCNIFAKGAVKFEARVMGAITINEIIEKKEKLTAARQNQKNDLCAQRRLRSAWASAQSEQSLRCPHEEALGPYLPTESTTKTLIRRVNAQADLSLCWAHRSFCWFCHVAAQILVHDFEICLESDSI